MTVPLNSDTRETYIKRMKDEHLHWAKIHYEIKPTTSMWLQLFNYALSEDIYGAHWDRLKKEGKL